MTKTSGTNKLSVFEFRHDWTDEYNLEFWKSFCNKWGKAWVFQKEQGRETGRIHVQGQISLKIARTIGSAKQALNDDGFQPWHFEPMSTPGIKAGTEAFYFIKPDTRLEGPWSDKDEEVFIPYHLIGKENSLYPWQKTIWESGDIDKRNSRNINVVIERTGCVGKSTICGLIRIHNKGIQLPPMNDPDKLMQVALCILKDRNIKDPKIVLIDIPRAIKQDTLAGMFAACEQIKDGWCYDWRHHWNSWDFHPPQVWVFTNTIPVYNNVSRDRWNVWTISEREGILVPLTIDD